MQDVFNAGVATVQAVGSELVRKSEERLENDQEHKEPQGMSAVLAKQKYGEVWGVDAELGRDDVNDGKIITFIFKRPTTASFNRYLKTANKNMASATELFVKDNLIEEHVTMFQEYCKTYPGLALGIGQKLLEAIGLGDNINFKKL